MRFYFTNQTIDRHYAREKELQIEKETGLQLENPFYDGDAKEIDQLDKGAPTTITADEIVGMDLRKIRESRGIVALMTSFFCIGSIMEIAICSYAFGKPVYIIDEMRLAIPPKVKKWLFSVFRVNLDEFFYEHPWVKYFATERFRSCEEFVKYWKEAQHG